MGLMQKNTTKFSKAHPSFLRDIHDLHSNTISISMWQFNRHPHPLPFPSHIHTSATEEHSLLRVNWSVRLCTTGFFIRIYPPPPPLLLYFSTLQSAWFLPSEFFTFSCTSDHPTIQHCYLQAHLSLGESLHSYNCVAYIEIVVHTFRCFKTFLCNL